MSDSKRYELICERDGERLDVFLTANIEGLSRSYAADLIKQGHVTVDGKARKVGYKLSARETVTAVVPPAAPLDLAPADVPLDVVYEDSSVIVVNKGKGVVVHPSTGHSDDTLVNGLLFRGESLSSINGVMRPGIVHRIDKDTTGLLVIAKTDLAHLKLSEQFAAHSIERTYLAIVCGVINDDENVIDAPIGRDAHNRLKMAVDRKNGKRAVTRYKVLSRFKGHTYAELSLETGRTHQIRVHMAHINRPVLGDEVYSRVKTRFKTDGQVLHAKTLGFVHPETGETVRFDSELPKYFSDIISDLSRR